MEFLWETTCSGSLTGPELRQKGEEDLKDVLVGGKNNLLIESEGGKPFNMAESSPPHPEGDYSSIGENVNLWY
jgi:hypothetical protein